MAEQTFLKEQKHTVELEGFKFPLIATYGQRKYDGKDLSDSDEKERYGGGFSLEISIINPDKKSRIASTFIKYNQLDYQTISYEPIIYNHFLIGLTKKDPNLQIPLRNSNLIHYEIVNELGIDHPDLADKYNFSAPHRPLILSHAEFIAEETRKIGGGSFKVIDGMIDSRDMEGMYLASEIIAYHKSVKPFKDDYLINKSYTQEIFREESEFTKKLEVDREGIKNLLIALVEDNILSADKKLSEAYVKLIESVSRGKIPSQNQIKGNFTKALKSAETALFDSFELNK